MSGSVYLLDELRNVLAAQTLDHDLASGEVDASEAPADADDIATMHAPELIGGDVTHHIPVLRQIWWSHRSLGFRYPAERNIIVIDGGKR